MSRHDGWSPRELDLIVRFLDGLAEDIWHHHGHRILDWRDEQRRRAMRRSRTRNRPQDQISTDRGDR